MDNSLTFVLLKIFLFPCPGYLCTSSMTVDDSTMYFVYRQLNNDNYQCVKVAASEYTMLWWEDTLSQQEAAADCSKKMDFTKDVGFLSRRK